jgi:2'-5' RNA ligase
VPTIIGCTLPEPYSSTVESIRDELVDEFGVDEYANPFPHFTLYALDEDVDVQAVATAIEEAAEDHAPFSVHTDGIGLFPQNVVWLPVAKSPQLTAFQSDVVQAVEDIGTPPVPYYEPHRWFPHVGFAVGESDEQTGEIVEFLLDYDLEWDVTVDTVTITRPPDDGETYEQLASVDL